MNIEYYFKLGNVISNTKPSSPTLENVKNWYNEFQTHEAEKDYTIYLVGSFAEKEFGTYDGRPYDVDVVLLGNIKDESALLSLLEFGAKCGFDNDVMIDIWHNDKLMDLSKAGVITQTRSYNHFTGSVTINGVTNKTELDFWDGNGIELPSGLCQYTYSTDSDSRSWKKANARLVDKKYKGIQIKIKDIL